MGKQQAKDKDAVSLVDVLRTATATDMEEIQETVASLETDLAELVADKTREIDALRAAAKMLSIRINGKPPRQPRGSKAAAKAAQAADTGAEPGGHPRDSDDDPTSLRCQIYDAIVADGPHTIVDLCDRLSRTTQTVAMSVSRCPWFVRTGDEVRLA